MAPVGVYSAVERETPFGVVRGLRMTTASGAGVDTFHAVPYALPPFGFRRFREPVPVPAWTGVRDATRPGAATPQFPQTSPSNADEPDCLHVNVWAPSDARSAPVVFWVHGGGFISGHNAMPLYDGTALAAAAVVIVAPNYRVGFEGFGYVPGRPANRGFLDLRAALRWTRSAVAAFGGDPENITMWGQSAGATAVLALAAVPALRGEFARVAAQSPTRSWCRTADALPMSERIAAQAGSVAGPRGLESVPAARVARAVGAVEQALWQQESGLFRFCQSPVVPLVDAEDTVLPPVRPASIGGFDLLVGNTRDECRLLCVSLAKRLRGISESHVAQAASAFGLAEPERRRWAQHRPALDALSRLWSDWLFGAPAWHAAADHAAAGGGRSFRYEFAWRSPYLGGSLGACHCLELPLLFDSFTSDFGRRLVGDPPAPQAIELGEQMRAAWLGFFRNGDPGWAAFDPQARLTRRFDGAENVVSTGEPPEILAG